VNIFLAALLNYLEASSLAAAIIIVPVGARVRSFSIFLEAFLLPNTSYDPLKTTLWFVESSATMFIPLLALFLGKTIYPLTLIEAKLPLLNPADRTIIFDPPKTMLTFSTVLYVLISLKTPSILAF